MNATHSGTAGNNTYLRPIYVQVKLTLPFFIIIHDEHIIPFDITQVIDTIQ